MTNRTLSQTAAVGCWAVLLILLPLRSFSWVTTTTTPISSSSAWKPSTHHRLTSSSPYTATRSSSRSNRSSRRTSSLQWQRRMLEDANVLEHTRNFANFFNRTVDDNDVLPSSSLSNNNNSNQKQKKNNSTPQWFFSAQHDDEASANGNSKKQTIASTKISSPNTSSSSSPSSLEGRESLLTAFALVAVAVGIFSYAQTDAGANLLPLPPFAKDANHLLETTRSILSDPGSALEAVVDKVNSMGPLGVVYFGVAYTLAEILAIPAIPLTASAGYLFGPAEGTAVVLLSASVAATVSFAIGRTLLRDYVEGLLQDFPKFAKLDKAIGREGFKLMLLLRLSPIFPFALSNYLYGASSIEFPAFFGGTLLGFAPGTLAYVYTGYIGKALTTEGGGGDIYPWYVYAGGMSLFAGLLKLLADTATRIVEEIEAEDDDDDNAL